MCASRRNVPIYWQERGNFRRERNSLLTCDSIVTRSPAIFFWVFTHAQSKQQEAKLRKKKKAMRPVVHNLHTHCHEAPVLQLEGAFRTSKTNVQCELRERAESSPPPGSKVRGLRLLLLVKKRHLQSREQNVKNH